MLAAAHGLHAQTRHAQCKAAASQLGSRKENALPQKAHEFCTHAHISLLPTWDGIQRLAAARRTPPVHPQNRIQHTTRSEMVKLLLAEIHSATGPGISKESLASIWSKRFPQRLRRFALLIRFDQLAFAKHLHRYRPAQFTTAACTLCGFGCEGQAHAFGGCPHEGSHKMYCKAHGAIVFAMHQGIQDAKDCTVISDAEGHTSPFTVPPWLLPGTHLSSAPDLLVFPSLPDGEHTAVLPAQHTARILECYRTYCANLTQQFTAKSQAHAQLQRLMERDRWKEVTRTAMGVSHCGLITGNFAAVFTQIGLTPAQISRLAGAITRRAVQDSMNIYYMRLGAKRGLEMQATHAQPPPPPQPTNRRRRRDPANTAPPSRRTRYSADDPQSGRQDERPPIPQTAHGRRPAGLAGDTDQASETDPAGTGTSSGDGGSAASSDGGSGEAGGSGSSGGGSSPTAVAP